MREGPFLIVYIPPSSPDAFSLNDHRVGGPLPTINCGLNVNLVSGWFNCSELLGGSGCMPCGGDDVNDTK